MDGVFLFLMCYSDLLLEPIGAYVWYFEPHSRTLAASSALNEV